MDARQTLMGWEIVETSLTYLILQQPQCTAHFLDAKINFCFLVSYCRIKFVQYTNKWINWSKFAGIQNKITEHEYGFILSKIEKFNFKFANFWLVYFLPDLEVSVSRLQLQKIYFYYFLKV